ncbi:probable G-protein coupled receptor CG31760 [Aphidius gifuensis]|nr:probable G-protein coupled receptor CG31760 [Aphidius gifuensis]
MLGYFKTTIADDNISAKKIQASSNNRESYNDIGPFRVRRPEIEKALDIIETISTNLDNDDCINTYGFKLLPSGVELNPHKYDNARQKIDMTSIMMDNLSSVRHGILLDAIAKSLLLSIKYSIASRIIIFNSTNNFIITDTLLELVNGEIIKSQNQILRVGNQADPELPWFRNTKETRSSKLVDSLGWWTNPYFSCEKKQWLVSYNVYSRSPDTRHGIRDFISVDIDISGLEVNQCDVNQSTYFQDDDPQVNNQIEAFWSSHKCHIESTQCEYKKPLKNNESHGLASSGWKKGDYTCKCRRGFYSTEQFLFDGVLVEAAWKDKQNNKSNLYNEKFKCLPCAPGCVSCNDSGPCLASYSWPFRITLLTFSIFCACCTVLLVGYVYQHRKLKVFKVASPIFLSITLIGCAIMYLEMAAIFPVLDIYSCVLTKWTRHFGFCISYTALLMKTWRVSLTYRVKSAHKVKLTDKQLLQWMIPILLVMLIYLGTWTLSATPNAHVIADNQGLQFYQCEYNWWDHSLAIGEILFLAWGIRVCYNVRNAESLFNEARLISYAIYNIALVNTTMIAIHLFIFPHAGPDMKYTLGFVRTQLSTSVTVFLVFGPKVLRVLRGQGDQWDSRARARGITASFSLNGIRGLVAEETTDLYQENEELKEEIQKLAAQIEFMKIVHMEMHNRHIKPKMGGYFSTHGHNWGTQSPNAKTSTASFILKAVVERGASAAAAVAVEDSTFPSGSLHRARRMELLRERKAARENQDVKQINASVKVVSSSENEAERV